MHDSDAGRESEGWQGKKRQGRDGTGTLLLDVCVPFWGKRTGQPKTGSFQSEPEIKMQKREEHHSIISGKLKLIFKFFKFFLFFIYHTDRKINHNLSQRQKLTAGVAKLIKSVKLIKTNKCILCTILHLLLSAMGQLACRDSSCYFVVLNPELPFLPVKHYWKTKWARRLYKRKHIRLEARTQSCNSMQMGRSWRREETRPQTNKTTRLMWAWSRHDQIDCTVRTGPTQKGCYKLCIAIICAQYEWSCTVKNQHFKVKEVLFCTGFIWLQRKAEEAAGDVWPVERNKTKQTSSREILFF